MSEQQREKYDEVTLPNQLGQRFNMRLQQAKVALANLPHGYCVFANGPMRYFSAAGNWT